MSVNSPKITPLESAAAPLLLSPPPGIASSTSHGSSTRYQASMLGSSTAEASSVCYSDPNQPTSQAQGQILAETQLLGGTSQLSAKMPPHHRPTFVHSPSSTHTPSFSSVPLPASPSPSTAHTGRSPTKSKFPRLPNMPAGDSQSSTPYSYSMPSPAIPHQTANANGNGGNNWQPYRDLPSINTAPMVISNKETNESSPIPTSSTSYIPIPSSSRNGLYSHRRAPGGLSDAISSRTSSLKAKIMGKEGGLGRALILGWIITTLGFLVATAFWRGELFQALDHLSKELFALGLEGKIIFGTLILITTIPPLPLYSTLMILAGYTFGIWEGFLVSYSASLIGAVLVFVVARTLLRDCITKALSGSPTAQSLLNIIPQNPHLLLLIRVAPYPYNLLNVILASSPALTLRTYTACTALSLFKLFLHTWIGAGIHDISAGFGHPHRGHAHHRLHSNPHGPPHRPPFGEPSPEETGEMPNWGGEGGGLHRHQVRMYSTWAGIVLCIVLFVYMTRLAKKALAKAQAELEERQGQEGMQFVNTNRDSEDA